MFFILLKVVYFAFSACTILLVEVTTSVTCRSIPNDPTPTELYNHSQSGIWNQQALDSICQASYSLLGNGSAVVPSHKTTYDPWEFKIIDGKLCLLSEHADHDSLDDYSNSTSDFQLKCEKQMWEFEKEDFGVLDNGSVVMYYEKGPEIVKPGTYAIEGNILKMCAEDYDDVSDNSPNVLIIIGQVGSGISVLCLILHLAAFCLVPPLRNLPGYNLASMSAAYLVAYCFSLIGQIPSVLGDSCIASGVMVHYFFLGAFFWMNVMTFDVWRALKLATEKLVSTSTQVKTKKFAIYCLYAWGMPAIFTTASLVADNTDFFPYEWKPEYGRGDMCWITNGVAKLIFFVGPAFALFVVNVIIFIVCAYMIATNTMKNKGESQRAAKYNYALYVRLGVIMGVTWSIGILAALLGIQELWFVFDIFNSLQGLFIFLFFTCSGNVWIHLKKIFRCDGASGSSQNSTSTKSELQ